MNKKNSLEGPNFVNDIEDEHDENLFVRSLNDGPKMRSYILLEENMVAVKKGSIWADVLQEHFGERPSTEEILAITNELIA